MSAIEPRICEMEREKWNNGRDWHTRWSIAWPLNRNKRNVRVGQPHGIIRAHIHTPPFCDHERNSRTPVWKWRKRPSIKNLCVAYVLCRSVGRSVSHSHKHMPHLHLVFVRRYVPSVARCLARMRCFNDSRTMVAAAPSSRDLLQPNYVCTRARCTTA